MDNLILQILVAYWPVLIATAITLLLVYQYLHPKITAEDLQKGVIQHTVLTALQEELPSQDQVENDEWMESLQKVEQLLPPNPPPQATPSFKPKQRITISLLWVLFWIGASIFLLVRVAFNPYSYGGEAVYLGYFAYYIIIGLISHYRR
jgi:hypothetical protein